MEKGHDGIMVLVKKRVDRCIQLEKEDSNKQFIWFKISKMEMSSELQHATSPYKFQKFTKGGGSTIKTLLQH